jgi:hypothetical protein
MGGKGQASGSDYEADVFATIASYILAKQPLWFDESGDIPVAVRLQTGSPGDDFLIELRSGATIEVQAKRGASANEDFISAAVRLFKGLHHDAAVRAVMLVDSRSSMTVRSDFKEDVQRLADGLGESEDITKNVLARLPDDFDPKVLRRFQLVEANLDPHPGALILLSNLLDNPSRAHEAWTILGRTGLQVAKRGGRQDRDALLTLLKLNRAGAGAAAKIESYRDWAIETNATFLLAPLPDLRIATFEAWDEMTPPAQRGVFPERDAEAIQRYHGWEDQQRKTSALDAYNARKLLEEKGSRVIIGGAGSGKSTLTRRLVREACEGGMLAMRVSLKQVALAIASGKSLDDALVESAFQGSGIEAAVARDLLAQADFLIADGLDETPLRTRVAEELTKWMKGHLSVAVIVTTRPVGHSAGLLPGIPTMELMALHEGGKSRLAMDIFAAALADRERAEIELERFEEQVALNRTAELTARNPLLLSCMVALALEQRPLPRDRAGLFYEVTDLLYRTTPHERSVSVESMNRALAWRVAERAGWLLVESPAMTRDALVDAVAETLQSEQHRNALDSHRDADTALTFWEERRLLERLHIGSREYLTFVHRNLGEYAAARRVAPMTETELAAWLMRVRRIPEWRQVILIAAEAGLASRIVARLLDFEDAGPEELFLASEILNAGEGADAALVAQTIDGIGALLGGELQLQAAPELVQLAHLDRDRVSGICLPLLDHASPETRLTAEAGVLAGDDARIPAGLPRKWLEEYLPARLIRMGKQAEIVSPLPAKARDLQETVAALAVDALFRTAPRDEAEKAVERFVMEQASLSLLAKIEVSLWKHNATDIIEKIRGRAHRVWHVRAFDGPSRRGELLALLAAIAATVGAPNPGEDASRHTLPLISRVLTALAFWELDFDGFDDEDQASVHLVVDRVLRGIRLDLEALRRELASGYRIANALTGRGIYLHVREVAVRVNWKAAAAEAIEPEQFVRALAHPSKPVVCTAAELLVAGAAASNARQVFTSGLAEARAYSCYILVQVAPEIIGVHEAADVIRDRLRNGNQNPLRIRKIFEGLTAGNAALRDGLSDEIIRGLTIPNSFIAAAAADALEKLSAACADDYIANLRHAHSFWAQHPGWCWKCKSESPERFCPKCHIGIDSPLETLRNELARCNAAPSP